MIRSSAFVEWKEEFVSQERGSRIVHYMLKDSSGESILAVVGTERSLRHMVYVVADEFLNAYGSANAGRGGFKWRSRREVVDWLTSMLCKQKLQDSPRGGSANALESSQLHDNGLDDPQIRVALKMNNHGKGLRHPYTDIRWLGASWLCSKQLKHYSSFCRNETTISIQSFVFVMAQEENRYLAYIEDMYEDKKGQKKVKVRWFHYSQEVKGTVRVRNAHSQEVFFTPYAQVISAECVDGPAIVLTQDHYEKYLDRFPRNLLPNVHLCYRQFRTNKIKPFDLSKLRGYFSQPFLSSLESGSFLKPDSLCYSLQADFDAGENVMRGTKRNRNYGEQQSFLSVHSGPRIAGKQVKKIMFDSLCHSLKNVKSRSWHGWLLKVGVKIELLCQDSGIRGCWFRCTVLEISQKQIKVQYDDVDDDDGCGKLEEWIRAFRLASPDRLGMRCAGRPVIRPQPLQNDVSNSIEVGVSVDAWWSDGWWEGVVTGVSNDQEKLHVYIPGENLSIDVPRKDLRISRDWLDGKWVDLNPKPDILSVISCITGAEDELPKEPTAIDRDGDRNCVNNHPMDDVNTVVPEGGSRGNSGNENGDCDSKSRVQDSNNEVDSVAAGAKDSKTRVQDINNEVDSVAAGDKDSKSRVHDINNEVGSVSAGVKNSKTRVQDSNNEVDSVAAGDKDSKSRVHDSNNEVGSVSAGVRDSKTRVQDSNNEVDSVAAGDKDSKSRVHDSNNEVGSVSAGVKDSKTRVQDSNNEVDSVAAGDKDSKSRVHDSNNEVGSVSAGVQDSKTRVQDSNNEVDSVAAGVKDSKSRVQDSNNEVDSFGGAKDKDDSDKGKEEKEEDNSNLETLATGVQVTSDNAPEQGD
ncbi:hypothetical protein V2J09_015215 [Rumex salicifolius]